MLGDLLRAHGYETVEASSGDEALKQTGACKPDLIFLDVVMPGMDGYQTLERLRLAPGYDETPVIFLSAQDSTADKVRGLDMGGADYVTKPFDEAEVIARARVQIKLRALTKQLLEKQRRIEEDLRAAGEIQRNLLPRHTPLRADLAISWRFQPSQHIGGDMIGFHDIGQHHLAAYVIDVMGHGVPAALVTVSVSQSLTPFPGLLSRPAGPDGTMTSTSPRELLEALDREYPTDRFNRYFTLSYVLIDSKAGTVRHASAGHPPPLRLGRQGSTCALEASGPIIGLGGLIPFEEETIHLQAGDRILLYTDGLTERRDSSGQEFGSDRLCRLLEETRRLPLDKAVETIFQAAMAHGGEEPPEDDISAIVIEYRKT